MKNRPEKEIMKNHSSETTGRKQTDKVKNGKSSIPEGEPAPDPKALRLTCRSDQTEESALAAAAVKSEILSASVMKSYDITIGASVGITELVDCIQTATSKIKTGDMSDAEAMLYSQASALQTIFVDLARRAATQTRMDHYQTFLSLALKAQNQSRSTLQTLTDLKYPRQVTFMKQTNVAGQQQINNGDVSEQTATRTEESKSMKNELSPQIEDTRHERETLDFGTAAKASGNNPELVPVGKINRTKDSIR